MKKRAIQFYGIVKDSVPGTIQCEKIRYENELGFQERFYGQYLTESPDLCIEIHTRPFYAHMMPKDVPRAIYFCNLPGGYYHNEALLDLYDFVFYDNILGENYKRYHPECRLLHPWMPDAFKEGIDVSCNVRGDHFLGIPKNQNGVKTTELVQAFEKVRKCHTLEGRWFLGDCDSKRFPVFLGVCFKADEVYVGANSNMRELFRGIGTGLFVFHKDGVEILEEPRSRDFRQRGIETHHLFRSRIDQILSICTGHQC